MIIIIIIIMIMHEHMVFKREELGDRTGHPQPRLCSPWRATGWASPHLQPKSPRRQFILTHCQWKPRTTTKHVTEHSESSVSPLGVGVGGQKSIPYTTWSDDLSCTKCLNAGAGMSRAVPGVLARCGRILARPLDAWSMSLRCPELSPSLLLSSFYNQSPY